VRTWSGRVFAFLSAGADTKANTWGGGALERGHGAPLEPLAQLRDALGGVGATAAIIEAAELVAGQTAMGWARMVREQEFMMSAGADTKASSMGAAAHPRLVMLVSLRTAASAEAPSALIWLLPRLQQRGGARRSEIRRVSGR
jgi:hypothetical protein